MKSVTFTLKTITPMFMAGADQEQIELRPPSFKGMLRFWWRAMQAENDIPQLIQQEADLFGGTGKGQGRSKILIKLTKDWKDDEKIEFLEKEGKYPGITYLLYSTFMQKRPSLALQVPFTIELASTDNNALQQAEAAFWLLVNLGGIGTRSRRGGGNLIVTDCVARNKQAIDEVYTAEIKRRYIEEIVILSHLRNGFQYAQALITKGHVPTTQKYSNLSGTRILVGPSSGNWKDALEHVGFAMMKYREKRPQDYKIFEDFLLGNPNHDSIERAKFGLPLGGGFNNNPRVRRRRFEVIPNSKEFTRRASPLIIKVIQRGREYFPVLILLSGELLPYRVNLLLKETTKNQDLERYYPGVRKSPNAFKNIATIDIIADFIDLIAKKISTFNEVAL